MYDVVIGFNRKWVDSKRILPKGIFSWIFTNTTWDAYIYNTIIIYNTVQVAELLNSSHCNTEFCIANHIRE